MITDAQYAAATTLMRAVMDKHPGEGRSPDDMFTLFQQCLAVVEGTWERSSRQRLAIQMQCPSCGESVEADIELPWTPGPG